MGLIGRIFRRKADDAAPLLPLYEQVVARARQPHWYEDGAVPDTMDGRFDMIATLLSVVLLRLERGDEARQESVWLTELFVTDMDGQLRQMGIGDVSVGKHMGKMMSALGGRLGAYRGKLDDDTALNAAIRRNVYREAPASGAEVEHVARGLRDHAANLDQLATAAILSGETSW